MNELAQRGIEKVGKKKIGELERQEEVDFDLIMSFYQKELDKDREAFELAKKKKRNEVEVSAHAIKSEEKKALLAYCDKHGERDVEQIKKAIESRHAKELDTKHQLESAKGPFKKYVEAQLIIRKQQHEAAQIVFRNKQG